MTTLRDYQRESVEFLLAHRRAFVVAPAGAGKTVIAAEALRRQALYKFAWIANTREQVEQAKRALGPDLEAAGLVCCMAAKPNLQNCDVVIVDESHHAPANQWSAAIDTMHPDAILWGLSATPFAEDEERNNYLKNTFENFIFIDREEVLAGGHLVPGIVKPIDLDSTNEFEDAIRPAVLAETNRRCARFRSVPRHEHQRRVAWQLTQEHLQNDNRRNGAVVALAQSEMAQNQTVVVLVASIEHGERLAELIPGAAVLHSKLPKKLRTQRTDDLRAGRLKCAVATSLMDEGADFPVASVLILAAAGRSATKTIQRAGRVMRPYPGKDAGVVYDFVDKGLIFAHAQWRARLRVYRELGYNIYET